jgi:hypothetical protein
MWEGGGLSARGLEHFGCYEHGWPFVFATRYDDIGVIHLARFRPFSGECDDFVWYLLVLNVMIAIVLSLAVSGSFAYLFQCHLHFSLRSLFLGLALAAIPMAHLKWTDLECREDRAISRRLKASGCDVDTEYVGPLWLSRVSGSTWPFGLNLDGVTSIEVHDYEIDVNAFLNDVAQLKFLRHVVIPDGSRIESDCQLRRQLVHLFNTVEPAGTADRGGDGGADGPRGGGDEAR